MEANAATSHKSQIPAIILNFFTRDGAVALQDTPKIHEVYTRANGWTRQPDVRISKTKIRNLKRAGVETIAVWYAGRVADFQISELVRS